MTFEILTPFTLYYCKSTSFETSKQWRIQGDAWDARPQSKFFYFHAVFGKKDTAE